jgi:hypothetical protein
MYHYLLASEGALASPFMPFPNEDNYFQEFSLANQIIARWWGRLKCRATPLQPHTTKMVKTWRLEIE